MSGLAPVTTVKQLKGGASSFALARAALSLGATWPAVYPNPPTLASQVAPGGTSPINGGSPKLVSWSGQPVVTTANAAAIAGATTIVVASASNIQIGAPVSHFVTSSGNTLGVASSIAPGTVVAGVSGTTITLSQPLVGPVVAGGYADVFAFGQPVVTFLGFTPTPHAQYGSAYADNICNAGGTRSDFAIEFDYYGTAFALRYNPVATNPSFWVWVDGQPSTAQPTTLSGILSGNFYRYTVTFNNAGDNVARWRKVRIYMTYASFGGLEISPTDVVAASYPVYLKLAMYGDSWIEGALNFTPITQNVPFVVAQRFGGVLYRCGQGGTGYIANGGGGLKAAFADPARLAALIATGADIVAIVGSVNDVGQTPAAVQAAAATVFSTLKAGLPNAQIIAIGVQPNNSSILTTATSYQQPNAGVKAAAAAAGVSFYDALSSTLVYGTGYAGANATGTLTFAAQPNAGDTITLGGTVVTFVASGATGNQVNIQSSLAYTLTALQWLLTTSADANLSKCRWLVNNTQLLPTFATGGTAGNAYTLATSSGNVTLSGATLSGGTSNAVGDGNADLALAYDGIHPNPGIGSELFGRAWAEVIAGMLV